MNQALTDFAREARFCPHCQGRTRVEPHARLRWRCGACGAPRVPVEAEPQEAATMERAGAAELVRARTARAAAFGLRAGAYAVLATSAIALAIAAVVAIASTLAAGILAGITAGFVVLATWMLGRARKSDRAVDAALEEAWTKVANAVVAATRGEITARDLAARMRTTEDHAERMLAALSVEDQVRRRVTDEAELKYVRVAQGEEEPLPEIDQPQAEERKRS